MRLAAWVASNLFDSLACGPSVLGAPEVPVPFAATLESAWLPSRDRITRHVLRLLGQGTGGGAVPVPAGGAAPEPAGGTAPESAGGAAPEPIGGGRAQQPA
jgi:hypothetical protein